MRVRKISEVLGLKVFTDAGDVLGEVEEANLQDNKLYGWRVRVTGSVSSLIGARGILIPQQYVKAIGDVFVVSRAAIPSTREAEPDLEEAADELM